MQIAIVPLIENQKGLRTMTQPAPIPQNSNFGARLIPLALVAFVLLISSSPALGQWTTPNAQGDINNTNSGNVGIGTTTPTTNFKLDVTGAQTINYAGDTVSAFFVNATGVNGMPAFKVQVPASGQQKAFQLINAGGAAGWASFEFNVGGTGKAGLALGSGNATRDIFIYRDGLGTLRTNSSLIVDGNVGVGVASPAFKLDLQDNNANVGGIRIGSTTSGATAQIQNRLENDGGYRAYYGLTSTGFNTFGPINGGRAFFGGYLNDVSIFTQSAKDIIFSTNGAENARFKSGGNFGIGTTTPGFRLDVQGGQLNASGGLCIAGDCKTAWSQVGGSSQWTTSGGNIYYNSGSAGIGTTTPNKSSASSAVTVNGSASVIYELAIGDVRKGNMYHDGTTLSVYNNANGALTLGTNNAERLRVDASGNLGIGTTAPAAKLDVNGNVNVTGNLTASGTINAKYQDVAEWVESSQLLPAGTVVVLDQSKSNQVIASSQAYDTRVAGVISAKPGITLGEAGNTKVLVATTGRVKVKVDASAGPIQVGDLLVTSDLEGVAKKSEPLNLGGVQIHRPGTLIGKALEPLAKGTGEILVLLSLQ